MDTVKRDVDRYLPKERLPRGFLYLKLRSPLRSGLHAPFVADLCGDQSGPEPERRTTE
ncbi:hypothetical protein GCM10029976_067330 [Kribbella albertanoniae]|uniref:hypothetical protein n=1 Tax=Kribbella albertanoniae TaxID=1266829 RepID=UPI00140429B5|nr:hypothetical protein [Kribbella albertanoniae]